MQHDANAQLLQLERVERVICITVAQLCPQRMRKS
jgi:hypothetical protein